MKKGQKMPEETKKKISESKRGKKRPDLAERNKTNPPMLGKKHTEKTKQKISKSNMGKNLGKSRPHTEETKQKLSKAKAGELNPNWSGGKEKAIKRRKNKILKSNKDRSFNEEDIKACWKCKETKTITQFYKNKTKHDGLQPECKKCDDKRDRYDSNLRYSLKKNYGITLEQYNEMLSAQNNSCAGCGKHKDKFKRRLYVDHCHETGKVRGLLCNTCNVNLGAYEKILGWARNYLDKK